MMKAVLLCFTLFTASALALGRCDTSTTVQINGTDGQWGCYGASSRITVDWVFSADQPRSFAFSLYGYADSTVTVWFGETIAYGPFTPSYSLYWYSPAGAAVRIRYFSGANYQTQYGVTLDVTKAPTLNALVSGQTNTLTKEQPGGFVYFGLPNYSLGKLFSLDVEVFSYQGLREPSGFVSVNRVPTLEKYDYTNTTVSTSGKEECLIFVQNPPSGMYIIGVFLYGTAARLSVTATWAFNINSLQSGVRVSKTISAPEYYQVQVPLHAKELKWQISRQVPGGYPVAYITQGTVPSSVNYQWIMDTNKQSYISISIPDPNPSGSTAANPGNYIIVVMGQSAGFILQADWS